MGLGFSGFKKAWIVSLTKTVTYPSAGPRNVEIPKTTGKPLDIISKY